MDLYQKLLINLVSIVNSLKKKKRVTDPDMRNDLTWRELLTFCPQLILSSKTKMESHYIMNNSYPDNTKTIFCSFMPKTL